MHQPVWVGDIKAITRLIDRVKELSEYIRGKMLATLAEGEAVRRQEFDNRYGFVRDLVERDARWEASEATLRDKIENDTRVIVEIEQGRWSMTLSGPPEEVLADIENVQDVERVLIKLDGGPYVDRQGYNVSIDLDRSSADAFFSAPESQFIDLAGTSLRAQLELQRPWYWWFRARWAVWTFAIPVGIASVFVSSAMLSFGAELWQASGVQLGFIAVLVWGGLFAARAIVVPFELVEEGDKGRARRNLGRIAAVVVWVVTTIAIPILLNLLPRPQ
ncbi:hypothetical protein [Microbacterium testaceum]|uniref:hypothetical protein n=1 Tax=Microbacterium testaceum TaxID=2033 RepID=UPI00187C9644|nr:hypothetical protein [Microbacterium testaceum]